MRRVSILIPTFKEDRIEATLDRLTSYLRGIHGAEFEVLLIDDSSEEFRAPIRRYIEAHAEALAPGVRVVLVPGEKRGKGHAIKLGALASTGDIVFTVDADLPVPLEHVAEFLEVFDESGADAVIAERPFGRNVHAPLRFVLSRGLFLLQRGLVFQSSEFFDTQCGFKAFRGDLIRALARRQIVEGGMYDIEYLYMAVLDGKRVAKVKVVPNEETRESKIRVWKCLVFDPLDLVRVKLHGIMGKYRES